MILLFCECLRLGRAGGERRVVFNTSVMWLVAVQNWVSSGEKRMEAFDYDALQYLKKKPKQTCKKSSVIAYLTGMNKAEINATQYCCFSLGGTLAFCAASVSVLTEQLIIRHPPSMRERVICFHGKCKELVSAITVSPDSPGKDGKIWRLKAWGGEKWTLSADLRGCNFSWAKSLRSLVCSTSHQFLSLVIA